MLGSLLSYHDGNLDPALIRSLIGMRLLVETETARLAALNRTRQQLVEFRKSAGRGSPGEPAAIRKP